MALGFGAVISLKDNFSVTMKRIVKEQNSFKKDVEKTKKAMEDAYKKKHEVKINTSKAINTLNNLRKRLDPLRKKIVTMVAIKDLISEKASRIKGKLASLGKKVFSPIMKIKDATGGIFKSIFKKITSLQTMLGALAIGGGLAIGMGKAVKSGALLEQQMISMTHFIGVNTGMVGDELTKSTDAYMEALRTEANVTPFSNQEVVSAGARAINIAGGDTTQAMDLVKLAENMASLNPEKTLSDAIEALADLNVGESERMKEFGFKISAEDIEKAGGAGNMDFSKLQNTSGISLPGMFEGGAEKLSKSGAGMFSTLTGMIGSKSQDMGLKILETLKPTLQSAIGLVEKFSPVMDRMGNGIAEGVNKAVIWFGKFSTIIKPYMESARGIIGNVIDWIGDKFGWIGEHTGTLKTVFTDAWGGIQKVLPVAWGIIQPIIEIMISSIRRTMEVFKIMYPVIKNILGKVWEVVSPILGKMGELFRTLADFLQSDGFMGVFRTVWNGIGSIIEGAWNFIKPFVDLLAGAVGGIIDGAGKVIEWVGGKKKPVNNPDFVRGADGGGMKRAIGVNRVPYDNYNILAHEGERLLTKGESMRLDKGGSGITIGKIADQVVIREDADIDKIANAFVKKLEDSKFNYGGVGA